MNLPHLTCLRNGCSSRTSSNPKEPFQVRPHADCPTLNTRRPDFSKFGSTKRIWLKQFLRDLVSLAECSKQEKYDLQRCSQMIQVFDFRDDTLLDAVHE
jgi:hypothetical protein